VRQLPSLQVFLILTRLEETVLDELWNPVLPSDLDLVLSLRLFPFEVVLLKLIIVLVSQKSNQSVEVTEIT
jgi:hypothetical protein